LDGDNEALKIMVDGLEADLEEADHHIEELEEELDSK